MNRLEERVAEAFLLTKQAGEEHLVSLDRLPLYQQKGWTKKAADFLSALEAQGLKIVPVEESAKMAGAGYVALRPYMERGKRVKAARAVYAAMLNAVEG